VRGHTKRRATVIAVVADLAVDGARGLPHMAYPSSVS
jgi:hypothetical protein